MIDGLKIATDLILKICGGEVQVNLTFQEKKNIKINQLILR